jgi:UDP-2,3-diacylglucosamine hydrolase
MEDKSQRRLVIDQDARILIISDMHLPQEPTAQSRQRVEELGRLFEEMAPAISHVVLLGDIFEFWFEYGHVIPKGYHDLLWELKKLSYAGKNVVFFPGNHDYWLNSFFPDSLGVRVADDLELWVVDERVFALTHGDGRDPHDLGYRLLKAVLRAKPAIAAFRLVHPELAFAIARIVSRFSRNAAKEKSRRWSNSRFLSFSRSMFQQGADAVIVGHSHRAQVIDLEDGFLINTGNWHRHTVYTIATSEEISVRVWPSGRAIPIQTLDDIDNPPLGDEVK